LIFSLRGLLNILIVSGVIYALSRQNTRHSTLIPWICFGFAMFQLLAHHCYAQMNHFFGIPADQVIDQGAPLMILTIKLCNYAWASYDGMQDQKTLNSDEKQFAIPEKPTLLEFFGYVFFVGGFIVGPAFEYREYIDFINRKAPFDKIPNPTKVVLVNILLAVFCGIIFVTFKPAELHEYALSSEFLTKNIVYRIGLYQLIGLLVRCKYYFAWKFSEAACILTGLGYKGLDSRDQKRHLFNRVENICIRKVELASNPRDIFANWNKNTASWLRRSVYVRITETSPLLNPTIITYLVSALWHGCHPGYYLCFLSAAMMTISGRNLRRYIRPLFIENAKLAPFKPFYDFFGWMGSIFLINYCVMPFYSFTFEKSIKSWASIGYLGHIVMLIAMVAFEFKWVQKRFRRREKVKKDE
jgi:lysophospholipid acyltransferase